MLSVTFFIDYNYILRVAVKVYIQVDHAYIKIKYILCIHLKNNVSCIQCKHKNICDFSVSICMHDYNCMHTFIFYQKIGIISNMKREIDINIIAQIS